MRVAMIAPVRERCGIADYSEQLVEALRRRPEIERVERIALPSRGPLTDREALQRYFALERSFSKLAETVNRLDVDAAHLQHQYFLFGGVSPLKNHAAAFLSKVKIPLSQTLHEIVPERGSRLIRWTNQINLRHPNVRERIVHTEADAERLSPNADAEFLRRLHVLPVGVPLPLPMPPKEAAKAELGLAGRTVLTMYGFLSAKKGYPASLSALAILPAEWVLLIAGDRHPDDPTDGVERLKASVESQGLQNRVVFTGFLPETKIPAVMAATDTALAPFRETSGSASVAQLLSYGLPVVASDIPPHRELLRRQPGCLKLTDTENPQAFALEIRASQKPEAQEVLSRNALLYAQNHSWDRIAEAHIRVYGAAIRSGRLGMKTE